MTSAEIDALWTIDDPVAGYEALTRALEGHPEDADEIHTQIARTLGLQGKFTEGRDELAKVSASPSHIVQVRLRLEEGRIKNSSGDPTAAAPDFQSALTLAEAGGFDYYAVDAAHMLGIVTRAEESIDWNEKAIAMARKSEDARAKGWQGSLLNNLGWTYHDMARYDDALRCFEGALAYLQTRDNAMRVRIARWTIARCYRSMGRYEEALTILNDLAQYPEAGFVSEESGENLLALHRPEEAKPYFKKAHQLLSQDRNLTQHQPKRLERLQELGGE